MGSLQGFERLDLSNACMVLGVASQVATLCVGLAAGGGLKAAALAGVVGQGVTGLLGVGMLRGQLRGISHDGRDTGPSWRDMMHFGAALQLAGLLTVVQFQSGKITLGLLGNLAMVSEFEVAFRVANAVGSLPVLIMLSVIPAASHAWERGGQPAVVPLFLSTSRWVFSQAVMTLGLLWLLAPDITRLWLGPEHERIAFLIRLWVIVYAIILVWGPGTAVARGIGIPWPEVWGLTASVIVNIGLSLWWVPRHGTVGAITALGVSFLVAVLLFMAMFHRRSRIAFGPWFGREFLPRALAGFLAVALCSWLADGPLARILPHLGWSHGVAVTLLFMGTFSLLFAPLGDPQRLWHLVAQATAGVLVRRRESTGS
jgi:O-antigen/teichoic acid export membrane protein